MNRQRPACEQGLGARPTHQTTTLLKYLRLGLLFSASAATFGGCAANAGGTHRDPGTLVVVEPGDANTMNPLFADNAASFLYYSLVFDGLANSGAHFSVQPALATSFDS